jgi:hypothetical protein
LPTEWCRVVDRNDEAMYPDAKPGYVWLDVRGRLLHVWGEHLEFRRIRCESGKPRPTYSLAAPGSRL